VNIKELNIQTNEKSNNRKVSKIESEPVIQPGTCKPALKSPVYMRYKYNSDINGNSLTKHGQIYAYI